jgi:hypothetical protein
MYSFFVKLLSVWSRPKIGHNGLQLQEVGDLEAAKIPIAFEMI